MKKKKILKYRQPCPNCKSSDAYHLYEDGGYCFSCQFSSVKKVEEVLNNRIAYTEEYISHRGIRKDIFEFYGVKTRIDEEGKPYATSFNYDNSVLVRGLHEKSFIIEGNSEGASLFGWDKFSAGSANDITITEGGYDALATYQMLNKRHPVVSIRSAATAKADCARKRDYLNSFDRIYLCFDNDEPGRKAVLEVASLFDFNKVYHVKLSKFKDANDYLLNGQSEEFVNIWLNSKRFLPDTIMSSYKDVFNILDQEEKKPVITFPFQQIQEMTYGIRLGERILFTALEGIGKTEIIRAIEYHVLKTTDYNIGILHLEEPKGRMVKGLVGYELQRPVHLPDSLVSKEEIKKAYQSLSKRDDRIHFLNTFGSEDPKIILDSIRFLATSCDCKVIFLDHVNMVVSGLDGEDERKQLDYLTTRLAMMTEELNFALIYVAHVNDNGDTRSSRNIAKVADIRIDLSRDLIDPDPAVRNTTNLTIRKDRFSGRTGPAGKVYFDPASFMIRDMQIEEEVNV